MDLDDRVATLERMSNMYNGKLQLTSDSVTGEDTFDQNHSAGRDDGSIDAHGVNTAMNLVDETEKKIKAGDAELGLPDLVTPKGQHVLSRNMASAMALSQEGSQASQDGLPRGPIEILEYDENGEIFR